MVQKHEISSWNLLAMDEFETIDHLILNGGLEFVGIDEETQEPLYSFTPKIKELMPDLYDQHLDLVNFEVMNLWEKGYLNVDLMSENPMISLAEKSFDYFEVEKLSSPEQWSLNEIKRVLLDDNL